MSKAQQRYQRWLNDNIAEIKAYAEELNTTILEAFRDISGELMMNGNDCREAFKLIEGKELTFDQYDFINPRSMESINEELRSYQQ